MVGIGGCQFVGGNLVVHNDVLVVMTGKKQVMQSSAETIKDLPYCRKIGGFLHCIYICHTLIVVSERMNISISSLKKDKYTIAAAVFPPTSPSCWSFTHRPDAVFQPSHLIRVAKQ